MKKVMLLVLLSLMAQVFSATYTVDGYAYLENQTDHSGIKVFFQRVAPDATFSYTVYTDAAGYYSQAVESGIYEATFSKILYEKKTVTGISVYSNYTVTDQTLAFSNNIFGDISGRLAKGIYNVSDILTVPAGDTLFIEPGAELIFSTAADFKINGLLLAEGADGDSIRFTSQESSKWPGLEFTGTAGNSVLSYCVVENSSEDGINLLECPLTIENSSIRRNKENGIYFLCSSEANFLEISESEFINNNFDNSSGGSVVYCTGKTKLTMKNCIIENNKGGGRGCISLYQAGRDVVIENCILSNNTTVQQGILHTTRSTSVTLNGCIFSNNYGSGSYSGAVYQNGGYLDINNSVISGNSANSTAGGIFTVKPSSGTAQLTVKNCIIKENTNRSTSNTSGGGIGISENVITQIENTIIYGNSAFGGAGISCDANMSIINSVIYGNNGHGVYTSAKIEMYNCIVSDNKKEGFYNVDAGVTPDIYNSNFYNNAIGNFYNCNAYLGVPVTTNSNGDPCDAWYNISMDPIFGDPWAGGYWLTSDSPCIDAGTNTITGYTFPVGDMINNYRIWDGNGDSSAIVDMGAYEYGSISVGIENNESQISDFHLYQNYPNPFNPVTAISYSLPKAAQVELNVYNLQGQLVQSLVNGKQDKGIHKAEFNGAGLTSGMYIYSLKVDGKSVQSKKMMMLK
jgi:hypothetical protein